MNEALVPATVTEQSKANLVNHELFLCFLFLMFTIHVYLKFSWSTALLQIKTRKVDT